MQKDRCFYKNNEIKFLVMWIGTRCTLKCKRCCNHIPFLNKSSYDIDECIQDLEFIKSLCSVKKLQVQGGEPFTHPDFDTMLDYLIRHSEQRTDIATNGTVRMSANSLQLARDNASSFEKAGHLRIRISNYAIEGLKRSLAEQLAENSVHYNTYEFVFGNGQWFDLEDPLCKRSSYEECVKNYRICPNKDCTTLVDGILYVCGRVAAIRELHPGAETFPGHRFSSGLYVNIRKIRKSFILKALGLRKIVGKYWVNRFLSKVDKARPECAFCRMSSTLYPAAEQATNAEIKAVRVSLRQQEGKQIKNA